MDYMVYVAIVYYLITEIGGRIVEYNSGLKKVAGSWQLSRNSNWTLSNDFKIQIIYYWGSGGHGGNGGYGVHGNQRKLWRIYINARVLSGRHKWAELEDMVHFDTLDYVPLPSSSSDEDSE